MKYQKILGLVATAGLLLAGCATDSDNSNTWLSDPNAVHVSASVGSIFTRSNPAASDEDGQKSFNTGDVMGVSNNGTSITYTYNKGTNDWQPGSGSYLVWDASDLTFQCWYPAACKNTYSKGYIQEDQSNATEIAKSDYMKAEVTTLTEIPGNRQLNVTLVRKTARLILNIQSFNDQFDASTTKVNHIRIASKASTGADETSIINIKPLQSGEGGKGTTYTALVMPGTIEANLYFSTDEATETPLVVKTGALEAGKSYTYNLIVGKNTITVGGVTVAEWKTGNTLTGGVAKEEDFTPYVTMTAASKQTFKMTCTESYTLPDLEYSVNNGTWQKVVADNPVEFGDNLGSLRLRGKCPYGTAKDDGDYSWINFGKPNVKVDCSGDIRTLIDYTAYKTVATGNCRFISLFKGCKALASAPELPATELKDECYNSMFEGCTSLTKAPDLPAIKMKLRCYEAMFKGCTALTEAPMLSAKDLGWFCYQSMFDGCESLVKAPDLPATTLQPCCYSYMFANCKSLKIAPVLGAEILPNTCYYLMFQNCESLESVTMLATSVGSDCLTQWLDGAGTKAENRTLKVSSKDFYDNNIAKKNPSGWKIGLCKVLDKDGNEITEQ